MAPRAEAMKKLDRKMFLLLLLLSLISIVFTDFLFGRDGTLTAIVEVNGKEYGRYSLEEKEAKTLDVRTEFGYNKIEISDGEVRVTESDCPDKLEVHQGEICSAGQMLVCLPNRLVVRVSGEREVDGLAY